MWIKPKVTYDVAFSMQHGYVKTTMTCNFLNSTCDVGPTDSDMRDKGLKYVTYDKAISLIGHKQATTI